MIIILSKYVMTFVESFLFWNRTETGIGTEPKEYGVLGICIKKKNGRTCWSPTLAAGAAGPNIRGRRNRKKSRLVGPAFQTDARVAF